MKCGFFDLDITPHLGSIIPGIYEARLAPTSALEADTGDRICEESLKLYNFIK